MNATAQNRAIAEATGWTEIEPARDDPNFLWGRKESLGPSPAYRNDYKWLVPNFCGSIDAMHEAERSIAGVEALALRRAYVSTLMRLVGVSPDMHGKWSFIQDFALLHATAPQRAKAFLRALGKWEDAT